MLAPVLSGICIKEILNHLLMFSVSKSGSRILGGAMQLRILPTLSLTIRRAVLEWVRENPPARTESGGVTSVNLFDSTWFVGKNKL